MTATTTTQTAWNTHIAHDFINLLQTRAGEYDRSRYDNAQTTARQIINGDIDATSPEFATMQAAYRKLGRQLGVETL